MKQYRPEYTPVRGKSYSLFGSSGSTTGYFGEIKALANEILKTLPDAREVIEIISSYSSARRTLIKLLRHKLSGSNIPVILNLIDPVLKKYTEDANDHLKSLSLSKSLNRILATSRDEYHLYMLEIELTNRMFVAEFKMADRKIALLPHCLQDFSVSCRSVKKGFDFQCNKCSDRCFQNHASEILNKFNIEPYIWLEGDMKKLAKILSKERRTLGVLGIACIPELVWGMRTCRKNKIPVVGIPLNANRCIRWFGEFFPNNVDLSELEKLLT